MKRLLMLLLLAALLWWGRESLFPASVPTQSPVSAEEQTPDTLFTANGQAVPRWLYGYWLRQACENAQSQYDRAGQAPDWAATGPGSLAQKVRDQALADTLFCVQLQQEALARGCPLTAQDQAALDLLWQQRVQAHGGESAYLDSLHLTADQARQLGELGQLYRKLHAQAADPASPYAPTPNQLAELEKQGKYLGIDRIYVPAEQGTATAAALFAQLNQADDPAALFPTLAARGADHQGPRTIQIGDGQLSPQLEEAALSLAPGRHSGILTDGDGWAILLRTPVSLPLLTARWLDGQLIAAAQTASLRFSPGWDDLPLPEPFCPLGQNPTK